MDSRRPQKPRRLKGTYAHTASKYTAIGIIGLSIGVMAVNELLFHPLRKLHEWYGVTEFERAGEESKQPVTFVPLRSTKFQEELLRKSSSDGIV